MKVTTQYARARKENLSHETVYRYLYKQLREGGVHPFYTG